jgi:hypothetical protein
VTRAVVPKIALGLLVWALLVGLAFAAGLT